MKRIFVTAAALLLMVGCKEIVMEGPALADNTGTASSGPVRAEDLGDVVSDEYTELYGTWTGFAIDADTAAIYAVEETDMVEAPAEIGADKISIAIKNLSEDHAEAHSIIYGERYELEGTYKKTGEKLLIHLYTGAEQNKLNSFELVLEGDKLTGTYRATKTDLPKRVELKHNIFKYDPAVMLTGSSELIDWDNPKAPEAPKSKSASKSASKKKIVKYERPQYRYTSEEIENINASTGKLTEAQLKNFTKFDLEILRNTIYARHGFAFKKEFLRSLFNYTDWYVAISDNVDGELTDIEKANITLLTRMEKYAEDHYQYFGR